MAVSIQRNLDPSFQVNEGIDFRLDFCPFEMVSIQKVGSKLRSFEFPSFTSKEVDGDCLIE
jgi:hypothetical protein